MPTTGMHWWQALAQMRDGKQVGRAIWKGEHLLQISRTQEPLAGSDRIVYERSEGPTWRRWHPSAEDVRAWDWEVFE